jgi:hypothetical protein
MLQLNTPVRRIYDGRVGVVTDTPSQNPLLATGEVRVWCPGHCDDDYSILSGLMGETYYCDGSCQTHSD